MIMEEYILVRILSRKNKDGKSYYIAVVLFNNDNDSDLLRILISEEQIEKINELLKTGNTDVKKYIKIEYNNYQKCYQPKLKI